MFNYYLTHCSSINILSFIGEWEHFKDATFNMLLPELHLWMESIYFICACKQVFNSALHSCVQFRRWKISANCPRLGPLICQKHFKFLPQLIDTGQHLDMRQPLTFCMKQQGFMLRSLSSHKAANMRLLTGHDFTMRTSSDTETRSAGQVFAMRASQCKKQCITITSAFLTFTMLTKALVCPTMAADTRAVFLLFWVIVIWPQKCPLLLLPCKIESFL